MSISALSGNAGSVNYQQLAAQAPAAKQDSPNDGDADDIKAAAQTPQTSQQSAASSVNLNGRVNILA
jgi:hypothetical protein